MWFEFMERKELRKRFTNQVNKQYVIMKTSQIFQKSEEKPKISNRRNSTKWWMSISE